MRSPMMRLLAVLIFTFSAASFGIAAEEREADHQALRALRDKVTAAINKQDIDTLGTCFAREFSFTALDQTVLRSPQDLRTYYDRMFHGPKAIVETMTIEPRADILTRFTSNNTGYCMGSSTETYHLKNGDVSVWNNRWTALVVKQDGEWKIAAAHAGANFLDNPLLHRVQSFGWFLAAGTGVVGFLFGGFVGLMVRRKK